MTENELKQFVLEYFATNNARILESGKHTTVQVPKRMADKLNCETILNITFDKQYAEKNKDIEFIAKGSALLNKILEAAEKRGLTTVKQYKGPEFKGLEMNFKVTFESVDKKEKMFSLLVDLKNKKIAYELAKTLEKKQFKEGNGVHVEPEDIEEGYAVCIEEIRNVISPDVEKIQEKLKAAMEKEKGIIEKFYDGIIADLRKAQEEKIKAWKETKGKAHHSQYVEVREKYRKEVGRYEDKILEMQEKNFENINNYFAIKQKRLAEIENQYKLSLKLLLYNTALVVMNE